VGFIYFLLMSGRSKIVLQNRDSLLYWKGEGQWTPHVEEAVQFEHIADASAFAQKSKITVLDIVMNFGDPRYDVRLSASA
jgi:hypothetical protein